jgi:hypothetical protein
MRTLALGLLLALPSLSFAAAEPNTQVPAGSRHYAATTVPDRIVASPAADPAMVRRGLAHRRQRAGAAAGDRPGR